MKTARRHYLRVLLVSGFMSIYFLAYAGRDKEDKCIDKCLEKTDSNTTEELAGQCEMLKALKECLLKCPNGKGEEAYEKLDEQTGAMTEIKKQCEGKDD